MEEIVASILIIAVFGYLFWCISHSEDTQNSRDFTTDGYPYPPKPPYVPRPGTKIPKLSYRERYMLNELLEIHRYAIRMRQMVRPMFLRGTGPQHYREIRDLYALAHAIAKDEGVEYIKREIG